MRLLLGKKAQAGKARRCRKESLALTSERPLVCMRSKKTDDKAVGELWKDERCGEGGREG